MNIFFCFNLPKWLFLDSYEDSIPIAPMTPKKQQRNPTFRCHLNQDRDQHGMFTNRGNGDYVNFIPNEEFLTFEITGDKGVHVISLQRAENNSVNSVVSVATQTSLSCVPNLHPPVMQYNIPSSSNGSGFTFLHKNLEKKFCESKCPITPVPQPSRDCASLGGSSLDLDLSEEFAAASSDSSKDASAQNSLSENDNSNPSSQSNSSSSVNGKATPGCANVAPAQPGVLILDKSFRSSLQSPLSSRRIVEINSNHSQRSFCTLPSSLPIQNTLDSKDSSSSSAGASSSNQESILANKKNGDIKFIDDPETPCVEKMSFLPHSQSSSFYVNRSHSANHLQHMAEFTNVREQSGSAFKHSQRRLTLKPNPPCGKMHCHDCIDGEKPCEKTALIGEEGFFDLACSCPAVKKPTTTPKSSPKPASTTTTKSALKKEFHSCEDINKKSISKNDQSFKNLEQLARSENSSPVRRRSNAPPIEIPDLSLDDTSEMSDSSVTVSLSIPSSPVVARKKTQRRGILYSPLLLRKMRRQKLVDSSDEDGAFSGEDMPGENFKDLESFQKAYIRRKVEFLL